MVRTKGSLIHMLPLLLAIVPAGCELLDSVTAPQPGTLATEGPQIVDLASTSQAPHVQQTAPPTASDRQLEPVCKTDALPFGGMKELSVDLLVEQVLARNPSLQQMMAAWQAASARYPQVTSLEDPNLGLAAAPASIGSNNVEFGYRVELVQKYPFPGKRNLRGQGALAEATAAGKDVDDMRLQLVEAARDAFYEYYLVFRAMEVNEENLKLLNRARKSAETRVSTAKASPQEVKQIDVEIGRQEERGVTLERMKRVAVARINTLMHVPVDGALPPPPAKLTLPGKAPAVERLRAKALANRPDVQAVAARVSAEEAQLALALREYYPDFEGGVAYDTIMGNGPARDLAPQVSLRMNLPMRLGKRAGAVAEAEGRVSQRRAELARLTDLVTLQVQEAYEQLVESERVVRLYERTILPAAESNVELAEPAYATGQIPLLALLEAQRNLVMLRDRFYELLAEHFRRRAALERAVGASIAASKDSSGTPSAPKDVPKAP